MALRLGLSTCPSVRFSRDGSWESESRVVGRVRRAGASGRRLRRRKPSQRAAARSRHAGSASRSPPRRSRCSRAPSASAPTRTQQIPQNQNHRSRRSKRDHGPLTVVFVDRQPDPHRLHLEMRGPRDVSSGPIPRQQPRRRCQTDLPTGTYMIGAADIPGARPASSWSAPSAPRPRTTSCSPNRPPTGRTSTWGRIGPSTGVWGADRVWGVRHHRWRDCRPRHRRRSARRRARLRCSSRGGRSRPEQPDLGPAIQEATSRSPGAPTCCGSTRSRASSTPRPPRPRWTSARPRSTSARRRSRSWPSGSPRARRRSRPRSASAARPTCRPAPCSSRWARPSATSTPRPPA